MGIFVSNFVGKMPFAAVNLIMPFLMIFGARGFTEDSILHSQKKNKYSLKYLVQQTKYDIMIN